MSLPYGFSSIWETTATFGTGVVGFVASPSAFLIRTAPAALVGPGVNVVRREIVTLPQTLIEAELSEWLVTGSRSRRFALSLWFSVTVADPGSLKILGTT